MTPDIEVAGPLAGPAAAAVLDLASAAAVADAVRPLSEHVLLHVRYGGDPQARDLLLRTNQGGPIKASTVATWPGTPTWTCPARPTGRVANWSSTRRTGAAAWAWP